MTETQKASPTRTLVTVFGRLFDNEFATLDGITISCRAPDGIRHIDESSALDCMLFGQQAAELPVSGGSDTHAMTRHRSALGRSERPCRSAVGGLDRDGSGTGG